MKYQFIHSFIHSSFSLILLSLYIYFPSSTWPPLVLDRGIVPPCKKFDHVEPALSQWSALAPFWETCHFQISNTYIQNLETDQPRYLSELLQWYVPPRLLRSSGKKLLVLPVIRSANGRRSISYAAPAPAVWNSLPENIRGSVFIPGNAEARFCLYYFILV